MGLEEKARKKWRTIPYPWEEFSKDSASVKQDYAERGEISSGSLKTIARPEEIVPLCEEEEKIQPKTPWDFFKGSLVSSQNKRAGRTLVSRERFRRLNRGKEKKTPIHPDRKKGEGAQ